MLLLATYPLWVLLMLACLLSALEMLAHAPWRAQCFPATSRLFCHLLGDSSSILLLK